MKLVDGLLWRYRLYAKPHFLLNENLLSAISRMYYNSRFMRESKPICYIYADASNIGDRASAMGVRFLFDRPGVELFAARAGLKMTFRTINWLEHNRPNARIIIGGGGLLQECFVPFWVNLLKTTLPFVLFGVGVNEMQEQRKIPSINIMKEIAHRAIAIHVRDKFSQELLQHGQVSPVTVGVCPSVNYLVSKFKTKRHQPPCYLLHVRHPVDVCLAGGDPEKHRQKIKVLAHKLNLIYDETNHIKEDLSTLSKRYQRAKLVVSSRLHGCIFSFAFGVPFVPIVTDKKTAAFITTHIPENPVLDVHFSDQEIVERYSSAEKAQAYSTERLQFAVQNNVVVSSNILHNLGAL